MISGALEVEADLQELLDDREPFLRQQVDHHWHVVAQEDFAVVESFVGTGVLQSSNASGKSVLQWESACVRNALWPFEPLGLLWSWDEPAGSVG